MVPNDRKVFYGWWIVAASFVQFLLIGGATLYGFGSFFNPIKDEFGWSSAETSLAFSMRSAEMGIAAPLVGFFIDRFQARTVVFSGMVLLALAFLLMSQTNSLLFFYGTFILISLGSTAAVFNAQYVVVANWFSKRRAWAMGVMSTGMGLSGITGLLLVWLIDQYGWRTSLNVVGIVTLTVGIPLTLALRHRPEPYGYLPDGETGDPPPAMANGDAGDVVMAQAERAEVHRVEGLGTRRAIRTRSFWLLQLFTLLTGFAMNAVLVLEMPYLESVGISRGLAGLTMFGITGFSLIGRLGFSWLGDFYDKRYLLAIGALLQFVGVFIFAQITSPWLILPFLITYGPGYIAVIALLPPLQADYFGLKDYGTIRGLIFTGLTVSGVAGPLLAGWVNDTFDSYRPAFLAFALMSALAIPVLFLIRSEKGQAN